MGLSSRLPLVLVLTLVRVSAAHQLHGKERTRRRRVYRMPSAAARLVDAISVVLITFSSCFWFVVCADIPVSLSVYPDVTPSSTNDNALARNFSPSRK